MKVIGISSSPRRGGNTEILVLESLKGASLLGAETNFLRLSDLNINPCCGCQSCVKDGVCIIEDDMQIVYRNLIEADGIIIGSPVYFWSVSALAKIFMDRTYALRYPTRKLRGKVGGAIAVAAHRGCSHTLSTINNFFLHHKMIVIGLGVSGYASQEGDVRKDERAVQESREMGKEIVNLILKKGGEKNLK
ncbi:MAG: flavodoxin family protein [Nitrososphaeria archaeon]